MAKVFSFACWNVEQLTNAKNGSGNITCLATRSGPPHVFGIFEVKGSQTFDPRSSDAAHRLRESAVVFRERPRPSTERKRHGKAHS